MRFFALAILTALVSVGQAATGTQAERLDAFEQCSFVVFDNTADFDSQPEAVQSRPPEDYVRERFQLSSDELLGDILALSRRYSSSETNDEKRVARMFAVELIGRYGSTNNLAYLSTIWRNPADYAQVSALESAMTIVQDKPALLEIARDVFSPTNSFSATFRSAVYARLHSYASDGELSLSDESQKSLIAEFFLERAATEREVDILYVDRVACQLNPSYRHSQQRRHNLAAARPATLTGRPAELYDARQRDAMEGDRNAEGEKAEKKPKDEKKEDEK